MPRTLRLFAPAKINLFLHVIARRPDGYHELESLVVFAGVGDEISVSQAPDLSLGLDGPFAPHLADEPTDRNLVFRAARALREAGGGQAAGARLVLDKRLPVASGIGGGSADAAAALRLLQAFWGLGGADLQGIGLALGADVPVCLMSRPAFMTGIGETVVPAPALPEAWILLVNSGTPVPTGPVFKALDPLRMPGVPGPSVDGADFADGKRLAQALSRTRNDLQAAAIGIAPDIADVLAAIDAAPGALFARMSGSGGTCFGFFAEEAEAGQAARAIKAAHPGWWAEAGPLLQAAPEPSPESWRAPPSQ